MNQMQGGRSPQPDQNRQQYNLRSSLELARWLAARMPKARGPLAWILVQSLVISLCNLATPMMIGRAIDSLFLPERLLMTLALLGAVHLTVSLFGWMQGRTVSRLSQTLGRDLRQSLYGTVLKAPVSYTDTHSRGEIMSKMTNDTDAIVQTVSVVLPGIFSALITIIGCALILVRQNATIMLVNLGVGLVMVIIGSLYSRIMFRLVRRQQAALGELNAVVAESMEQRHSIFAYRRQGEIISKMDEASDRMERIGIRTQLFGAGMEPLMGVFGNISFLVTAAISCLMVIGGTMTVGGIQSCLQYARQMLKPLTEMGMLFSQMQGGLACTDRVRELDSTPPEADAGTKDPARSEIQGGITFEDIDFSYIRGKKVLDGLNLTIRPEETVAIVGATGAGKTTLINLLLRFYEPDRGQILLDGTRISDMPRSKLYSTVTAILQDGSLMSVSIGENIAYGRPAAAEEEIRAAAETVHADGFIRQLPEGYATVISQEDSILSAGQRQLICLARIPLMNPKVLILDEATSSVDAYTEQLVQKTLLNLRKGRTCVVIAHRLNTIRNADRIVVLDGGEIAEEGTHEELAALKGKYWELLKRNRSGIEETVRPEL